MRITQWGEYGVHCLVQIGMQEENSAEPVGAAEIADTQKIALDYTQQILQRLRKGGLIASVRGPLGGYKLAKSPESITLKDILTAAEGDTFEIICDTKPINGPLCTPTAHCGLRTIWGELKLHVDQYLTGITLRELIQRQRIAPVDEEQPIQIGAGLHSGATAGG